MRQSSKQFGQDRRGNVAIIFALSALPLLAAVGAAVDYSGAANLHSQLQADTDAAVLAACKDKTRTSETELKALAQNVLNGYMPGRTVTITNFKATSNPRTIELTSRVSYPPQFMKFAGDMVVSTMATCAVGESHYEIALVLDTTGSMDQSAGTGTKIQALRTAATNFVNTMFTSFDEKYLQISIVPFAAAVRVDPNTYAPNNVPSGTAPWIDSSGTSPIHWSNVLNPTSASLTNRFDIFKKLKTVNSNWGWAGCFEALPYPYNTQDVTPSSATPETRYVPLFAPDEAGSQVFLWPDKNNNNSYIDDGSGWGGSCDSFNSNMSTRFGQACKYNALQNRRTNADGPNWGCTSRALTPLTRVKATLTDEISRLNASGQTNVAEGLHWGWRTISNTGVFTEASAYDTPNRTKIVVLMTDGVNTWSSDSGILPGRSQYSAYGYFTNADGTTTADRLPPGYGNLNSSADTRNAIDQLTRETCTNMKAKNIVIYSVAFSTPGDAIDASGQQLIKDCASDPSKYFLASDAASLNTSFAAIAQGIGELRITK